jgi:hypothetical protein
MMRMQWIAAQMLGFLTICASAQIPDYTMQWGEFQVIKRSPKSLQIVQIDARDFYVVKSDRKGEQEIDVPWVIERYDKQTFERTDSILLVMREGNRSGHVEKILSVNNELVVLYSIKKDNKITLFSRRLNKLSFTLEEKSTRIYEIAKPKGLPLRNEKFEFALSPDESKVFVFRNFSKDPTNHQLTSFAMLDGKLNLLWQKTVTLPYGEGLLKILTLKVNDTGQSFVLAGHRLPNQLNGVFELFIASNGGQKVLRYPVQFKEGFPSSVQIELEGTKNILCTGFYSKTGGRGSRGTFFINLNLDHSRLPTPVVSDFDTRFILEEPHQRDVAAIQARAEMDAEAELDRYVIDRIVKNSDGSVVLIAEQRYAYSISSAPSTLYQPATFSGLSGSRTMSSAQPQPSRNYRGDILIVKLDSGGHKLWEKRIHKSQDTDKSHRLFSSYLVLNLRGKLTLLFNEDQRNITSHQMLNPKDFAGKKSILVLAAVDDAGEVIREWLYQSVHSRVAVSPAMCSQVSDRELILYGYRGFRQQFSRINFK